MKPRMAEHSPTPWRVSHGYIVLDADGTSIANAWRDADAAFIVEAVNEHVARHRMIDVETLDHVASERDRLRDLVRRLCDELESHYHEPALMDDPCIVREARAALGEEVPE